MKLSKSMNGALVLPFIIAGLGGCASTNAAAPLVNAPERQTTAQHGARVPMLHGLPTVIRPDIAARIAGGLTGPTLRLAGAPPVNPNNWSPIVYTCQQALNDCTKWTPTAGAPPYTQGLPMSGFALSNPVGTIAYTLSRWWIANEGASNILFSTNVNSGSPVPGAPLNDAGQYPVDVDANTLNNTVAVANIQSVAGGSGSVSVYQNNVQMPTLATAYSNIEGIGIALDKNGDCYFSFQDLTLNQGHIEKYPHCRSHGKLTVMPNIPPIGFAGGLAIDHNGGVNLYYVDQFAGKVFKCAPATGPCTAWATGFVDPIFINFDSGWQHLWVTDAGANAGNGAICSTTGDVNGPPQCYGTPVAGDQPLGIAPAPGAAY